MTVSSLMIDGINSLYQFQPLDPVLAVVYGGMLCGAAFGLMLRQGATTGGTELAARLLKIKVQQLPIGKLCLIIDLAVIVTYSLTFRQLTQALYSIAVLYICTAMMDKVVYGGKSAKLAYIISPHHEEITRRLLELDLGVTLLEGTGAYHRKSTEVVMCAFSRNYIIPVKSWCSKLIQTHLSLYVIHTRSWARALVSMIPPDCKIACGEQSPQAKKCSAPHRGNVLRSKKPPLQKFCGDGFIERIDLVRAGFAGASMHAPPVPPATASACRPAVSDRVCPGRTAPGTWLPIRRTAPSGARPATPAVCGYPT